MGVEGDFDEETARLSARVAAAERRDAPGGGGRATKEKGGRGRRCGANSSLGNDRCADARTRDRTSSRANAETSVVGTTRV